MICWQVVARTKTPQEILEEFERLEREKNERRLQQQTNPKVRFLSLCCCQSDWLAFSVIIVECVNDL